MLRAIIERLDSLICFKIMSGMLIDSIMGTIDHIYCDNTFHVITEQNHRRNTVVHRTNRKNVAGLAKNIFIHTTLIFKSLFFS